MNDLILVNSLGNFSNSKLSKETAETFFAVNSTEAAKEVLDSRAAFDDDQNANMGMSTEKQVCS